MNDREREDTRALWNRVADDWRIQVGDDGDGNRMLNSDPVLWEFAGDVSGLAVLDAGCGTGYLSRKLHDRGARVTGMDFSERMIEIARADHPEHRLPGGLLHRLPPRGRAVRPGGRQLRPHGHP